VGEKPTDVFRLAHGKINGFHAVEHTNPKANELRHLIRCMEIDFFAWNESKINWSRMPRSGRLPELFHLESDLQTIVAFNSNKSFALRQFGGTFQLTIGQLASRVADTGLDDWNLG
jgi:hypothetical protein